MSYPGPESVHTNIGKGNKGNILALGCISRFVPVSHVHLDTRTLVHLVRVTTAWHIRALRVEESTRRLVVAGWSCSWGVVREVVYRR